jgi:hypothetical protein
MKPSIRISLFAMVLFTVSCSAPTNMLTGINADGSCYRAFTEKVDPAFMVNGLAKGNNPFPVTIDSTWEISWIYRNSGLRMDFPLKKSVCDSMIKQGADNKNVNNQFTVYIRRDYHSVEEMAATFKLKKSHEWSNMKVKYNLEKKFHWFYTYFTYRETYPKIHTDFELPIENYMTRDEAQFWFTGKPDLLQGMNGLEIREYVGNLEDKYNRWFAQNIWNVEYKVLLANYDRIRYKPVTKKRLALLKDSIFHSIANVEDCDMEKSLNSYFKTKAFSLLWMTKDSPMKKFENDFSGQEIVEYFFRECTYKLKMPGEITQPNGAIVQGDTLVWKLTAYRMIHDDYVIKAQSRKTNSWAFAVTGLIVLLAVGSFFYKPKKRL